MWNTYSKKIISGAVSIGVLFSGVTVFAQGAYVSASATTSVKARPALYQQRRDMKAEMRVEVKEVRMNASSTSTTTRRDMMNEVKTMREEKRAEFAEKVKTIKDARKKATVERLNENLQKINEKTTEHFTTVLDKQDAIAVDIASRIAKIEAAGTASTTASTTVSVETMKADLAAAQTAIATARAAVVAQSAKVYSISITTEANLKIDVSTTRKALGDDLAAVRDLVKAAHDALKKVARELHPAAKSQN